MTKIELKTILEQHMEWLANMEWLAIQPKGKKANLVGADLDGADLHGVNLHGVNLAGACLDGANLSDANLSGVNLAGVNLVNANLRGVDLYGANLRGANLGRADLVGADLGDIKIKTNKRSSYETEKFFVNIFDGDIVKIGCIVKTLDEWRAVTESECLRRQDQQTWEWWLKHRDIIFAICESLK